MHFHLGSIRRLTRFLPAQPDPRGATSVRFLFIRPTLIRLLFFAIFSVGWLCSIAAAQTVSLVNNTHGTPTTSRSGATRP